MSTNIEQLLSSILVPVLSIILPIENIGIKTAVIFPLAQLLSTYIMKMEIIIILLARLFRRESTEKYIIITRENNNYTRILEYFYEMYNRECKGGKSVISNNKNSLIIEELTSERITDSFKNTNVHISFVKDASSSSDESDSESTKKSKNTFNTNIRISGDCSLNVLGGYLSNVLSKLNSQTSHISIYTILKSKKCLTWQSSKQKLTKTIENTIVTDNVKSMFFDNVGEFIRSEKVYSSRGTPYKRGYILHGEPGTGKTSLIKVIANTYSLPVFILNMSVILTNENLLSITSDISNYIGVGERYILTIEDFDRSEYNAKYSSKSKVTEDCLLNVIDGIDESHGRILVITANDLSRITKSSALVRPGRIDSIIHVGMCDIPQIEKIIKHYFEISRMYRSSGSSESDSGIGVGDNSEEENLGSSSDSVNSDQRSELTGVTVLPAIPVDIRITPAILSQLLQILDDEDKVRKVLSQPHDYTSDNVDIRSIIKDSLNVQDLVISDDSNENSSSSEPIKKSCSSVHRVTEKQYFLARRMKLYNIVKDQIAELERSPIIEVDDNSKIKLQELHLLSQKKYIEIERLMLSIKKQESEQAHRESYKNGIQDYIDNFKR